MHTCVDTYIYARIHTYSPLGSSDGPWASTNLKRACPGHYTRPARQESVLIDCVGKASGCAQTVPPP
eukprot:4323309-Pyramimonas_sp.AAC.1